MKELKERIKETLDNHCLHSQEYNCRKQQIIGTLYYPIDCYRCHENDDLVNAIMDEIKRTE